MENARTIRISAVLSAFSLLLASTEAGFCQSQGSIYDKIYSKNSSQSSSRSSSQSSSFTAKPQSSGPSTYAPNPGLHSAPSSGLNAPSGSKPNFSAPGSNPKFSTPGSNPNTSIAAPASGASADPYAQTNYPQSNSDSTTAPYSLPSASPSTSSQAAAPTVDYGASAGNPIGSAASAAASGQTKKLMNHGLNYGVNAINKITRKAGLGGLGSLLGAPGVGAPSAPGYLGAPASNLPYSIPGLPASIPGLPASIPGLPASIPGLPASIPSIAGGDDGKAAFDAAGRQARARQHNDHLVSARNAEARGDWHQAAFSYRNAMSEEITPEDMAAGDRNHTGGNAEMLKRLASDPQQKALNLRWAYCVCRELNDQLAGKPSSVDPAHNGEELFHAYEELKITDADNGAAWYYLCGVYWSKQITSRSYNYVRAFKELEAAEKCARISPSVKEKIQALKEHILPAKKLQILDTERWSWDVRFALIQHWENNDIMDHRKEWIDSNYYYDIPIRAREYYTVGQYNEAKQDVRDKYPEFKSRWDKYLAYVHSLPNNGIAPPQGPGDEPPALYCPRQWEQLAFGPLDFKTGRTPGLNGAR